MFKMEQMVYLISLIITIFLSFLLQVKKRKDNILLRCTIIILSFFTMSILISLLFYIIKIRVSLWNLSIVNAILSILLTIKNIKAKEVQKYEIKLPDIIFCVLSNVIIIIIAIVQYGIPFQIKYETTDASTHYVCAKHFMEEEKLLLNSHNDVVEYFDSSFFMIGAYVNEGIIFKIFQYWIPDISLYKVYIYCDLFMLFLSALLMYEIIFQLSKNVSQKYMAIFISLLYLLAYPLNSVLMGSAYLTLSLIFVCGVILLFKIKHEISETYYKILLFLLNFGIIHTYILFSIIVFVAEILYLIMNEKKKSFFTIIMCILLPILSGSIYAINALNEKVNSIKQEGPMYKNYYSNMILYVPIIIYALYQNLKNKEKNIEDCIFIFSIISIPILFLLKQNGIISNYYLMKFYYILWISVIVLTGKGLFVLVKKHFKIGIIISIVIPILLVISFIFTKINYNEEELMQDVTKENLLTISEMLKMNFNIILKKNCILNHEEQELIQEAKKYLEKDKENLKVVGGLAQINWINAIYDFTNTEKSYENAWLEIYNIDNINSKYLLAFKRATVMHQSSKKILEKYHYIYETRYGGVLKRNET